MSSAPDKEESISPSKIAMGELLKRIHEDAALAADMKAAFIADLESETPAALGSLRATLGKKDSEDAA